MMVAPAEEPAISPPRASRSRKACSVRVPA